MHATSFKACDDNTLMEITKIPLPFGIGEMKKRSRLQNLALHAPCTSSSQMGV